MSGAAVVPLFVYGTLQIPVVFRAVAGFDRSGEPAWLEGYARYCIADRPYPGIWPEPGARTDGLLYRGLDRATLDRLDAFEDDFYRRETLPVRTPAGIVAAATYVVAPDFGGLLLRRPWSLAGFIEAELPDFLRRLAEVDSLPFTADQVFLP